MVYKCFDEKTSGGAVKREIMLNEQLAQELHKPIIRKFEKQKVHPFLKTMLGALVFRICNW